jgi:hypothetical protein
MRGLIINTKNREITNYKFKAKSFIMASILALLIILACLFIKINLKAVAKDEK